MPKRLFTIVLFVILFSSTAHAGTTPPSTSISQTPSSPDGDNGWYVSPVKFDLTSTDLESGVASINYRIDGGSWQSVSFSDTLNLVQNPSFEIVGATTTGINLWEASVVDADTTYSQDIGNYAPSYVTASAKIVTTGAGWHGVNNKLAFAVANPYENMTASAWIKTQDVTESAYFTIYSLSPDGFGGEIATPLATSNVLTGTNGWTNLSVSLSVLPANATGVYIDIGLTGAGTIWTDAVAINSSTAIAETSVTVASDGEDHTFEYYAIDQAGNAEGYSCPSTNCAEFNLDTTPPGNWYNSGAFRGFFGSEHELYVYTMVQDATSGLSVFTDKYQYTVDEEDGFGRFSNLLHCNTSWLADNWVILISPPFSPGVDEAFLLTPKTDFCNSNWKVCKTVRFFSEDLAGNEVTKDFCLNGPWIRLRGEGVVRSNHSIDMLSEPEGDNTDGLIEISGTTIDFFTTSKDWRITNSEAPTIYDYDTWWDMVTESKTEITDDLVSSSGAYHKSGNFEIDNQSTPNDYDNDTFDQIVFIDGDLRISKDITIDEDSTALFIVSGDVEIEKTVTAVGIAIFADGDFYTAYNTEEGDSSQTLEFWGLYHADNFVFQRTLQGTNNDDTPSEDFNYEPKYLMNLKSFFGKNTVSWKTIE